jgi:hypothetical protein
MICMTLVSQAVQIALFVLLGPIQLHQVVMYCSFVSCMSVDSAFGFGCKCNCPNNRIPLAHKEQVSIKHSHVQCVGIHV